MISLDKIPIQVILLLLILLLGWFLLKRSRSRLAGRMIMILFILVLSAFVLFPDTTTRIANWFGIGRGTDFLFYIFVIFVMYALAAVYLRLRDTDRRITSLTRQISLNEARQLPGQVHSTAEVSPLAQIGENTKIWHHSQVRENAQIGANCILGKGVYVDAGVKLGDNVKIQNYVSIFHGVTIEDGVFIGPHVCFTNDLQPRAITQDGTLKGEEDWVLSETLLRRGASIGANATIRCGVTIGEWAMIGAGSVVTQDVPAYGLFYGNPARLHGYVCPCGNKLVSQEDFPLDSRPERDNPLYCPSCGWKKP